MKTKQAPSRPDVAALPLRVFFSASQALRRHASGGNILIAATVLALVVANIPGLNGYYFDFWQQEVRLQLGDFNLFSHDGHPMSLLSFINDALMAIFFFSIGLEIKREILVGELSSFKQALLPIVAAIGGMICPVLVYYFMSRGSDFSGGMAIPMATDIAFSLGVLAMLGKRVPVSLKIFLTTLAVVDDIGGIIVIAVCYSGHIEWMLLVYAAVLLGVLLLGSVAHIKSKIFYLTIGGGVWFLFLNSGIHPTIAGVLVAFCVPATPVFAPKKYVRIIRENIANFRREDDETLVRRTILNRDQLDWLKRIESASDKVISPLQELEDSLHPIVNFFCFCQRGHPLAWHGSGLDFRRRFVGNYPRPFRRQIRRHTLVLVADGETASGSHARTCRLAHDVVGGDAWRHRIHGVAVYSHIVVQCRCSRRTRVA